MTRGIDRDRTPLPLSAEDLDRCQSEPGDDPGIRLEMPGQARDRKPRRAVGYCRRQHKLIGEMGIERRARPMMIEQCRNRLLRDPLGRLSPRAQGAEARPHPLVFGREKDAGTGA
jgi:hypothetical protein